MTSALAGGRAAPWRAGAALGAARAEGGPAPTEPTCAHLRPASPPAPTCAHLRALAEAGRGRRVHAAGWAEHREDAGAGDAERGGFS